MTGNSTHVRYQAVRRLQAGCEKPKPTVYFVQMWPTDCDMLLTGCISALFASLHKSGADKRDGAQGSGIEILGRSGLRRAVVSR